MIARFPTCQERPQMPSRTGQFLYMQASPSQTTKNPPVNQSVMKPHFGMAVLVLDVQSGSDLVECVAGVAFVPAGQPGRHVRKQERAFLREGPATSFPTMSLSRNTLLSRD